MLYSNLEINKVVCLLCGTKIDIDALVIRDVSELDVPEDVKAKGAFFQTLVCPQCNKSVYLGFIAECVKEDNICIEQPKKKRGRKKSTENIVEDVVENAVTRTSSVVRSEDGTIDLDSEPIVANRLPRHMIECSACGKKFDVGTQPIMGGIGTKCKECLNKLVGGK